MQAAKRVNPQPPMALEQLQPYQYALHRDWGAAARPLETDFLVV